MVATKDFSGLTSSAWALARAEARAATESLDRGMGRLGVGEIEADGAGFRAFRPNAVPDGLFGILRDQALELTFGAFMVEMGGAGVAEQSGELAPGVGRRHIDDAHGFDAGARRLGIDG